MNQDEAMQIVAEVFAAGAANASARSSGALRQQRYRERKKSAEGVTKRNESVTRYVEPEASPTVTNRNESVTRDAPPLSIKNIEVERKKEKRGTRLSPEWSPSDADRAYARSLGWSESQINREAENFRDYWLAKAGADAAKTDWGRTWSRWIRNSKTKPEGSPASAADIGPTGFYAKFGSREQDAWDAYGRQENGKPYPRDRKGGWHFPSKYPPGYEAKIIADVEKLTGASHG